MLDKYQLEQLVAFADCGTLLSAAEKLHISQPALSKSMKKIEEDLGVSLFIREKNKIRLNQTGEYAVETARNVIDAGEEMIRLVHEYNRRLRTICVGSCAPYPMWQIVPELSSMHPTSVITSEIRNTDEVIEGLGNGTYDVAILPSPYEEDGYTSIYWGDEHLGFSLPITHPLAGRDSLHCSDLDGSKMLVFSDIGFGDEIHRKHMPNTEFLTLNNRKMIATISSMSEISTFFTKDTAKGVLPEGRIGVMISDPDAHASFYVVTSSSKHIWY